MTVKKNDTKIEEELTCHWKIDIRNLTNFDPSTQKCNKFVLVGPLWPKYIMFELKSTKELSFMTLKSNAKFEGKLICGLKNDMTNLANFHQSTWKFKNWDFDGILLSKVENLWAQKLQSSYVSWQWRLMQKLKRNWLVISKLTWEIWRILTQTLENLKNLLFNWLL